jgi:BirA family biotin operon repressor/biotin-[acetyl-CoA-carboxylase] ligase
VDAVTGPVVVDLDSTGSTQDEVRERLELEPAGTVVAVSARSQSKGRGRAGRAWIDPPGEQLALSVGIDGAPAEVLDDLPRRVADALLALLGERRVAWKPPNDLVSAADGAKVCGILVDARTTGSRARIVVGIGINLTGDAFEVAGREATSLGALGVEIDRARLRVEVIERVGGLLRGG